LCENQAVSWSEYSSHLSNVEYNTRNKIAKELLEYMDFLQKTAYPECFIQGVEEARNYVLYNTNFKNNDLGVDPQERLF
jgi:hypothetical protein